MTDETEKTIKMYSKIILDAAQKITRKYQNNKPRTYSQQLMCKYGNKTKNIIRKG